MPSIFDQIYEQTYGKLPTREGEAFERLCAVVTAIVFPNADVAHDQKWRGQISKSLYQVDILRTEGSEKSFGEAKDYTERGVAGGKVGRGDLQKMGGALPDISATRGVFYSATDFTREARRYAAAATGITGRAIELMHVRPYLTSDSAGRITKIVFRLLVRELNVSGIQWSPAFAEKGRGQLQKMLYESGEQELELNPRIDRFFDVDGVELSTVVELMDLVFGEFDDDEVLGCFWLPGHCIKVNGYLVEILGLEFKATYSTDTVIVEIETGITPKVIVKCEENNIDRVIREKELREFTFDENGKLERAKT